MLSHFSLVPGDLLHCGLCMPLLLQFGRTIHIRSPLTLVVHRNQWLKQSQMVRIHGAIYSSNQNDLHRKC